MSEFEKPIIVISKCLEFEAVRYDGQVIPFLLARELELFADFIKVCPEVEIGLGIPRDPIRIIKKEGKYILIQPKTGEDITKKMDDFTDKFLSSLKEVDGFIFKSKSPTIGIRGIKVYSGLEKSPVIETRSGFFATKILDKYQGYPIEENVRLRHPKIREQFLIKLFVFAALRKSKEINKLEEFHKKNSLLIRMYNQEFFLKLNHENEQEYFSIIKQIFVKYPTYNQIVEILNEIYNMFKEKLNTKERNFMKEKFAEYDENKITYFTILELLKTHLIRFERQEILNQTIFEPYPKELKQIIDEKRDRNYWS